ncbi:MAG: acylphosphatase [Methanosaeta sp. ASP1-1]|jgi:acylphosphatase|nr:acylphosphatase [Methanomicrobia archaeon]MDD1722607.1 acylphosphatase [Methanothrix sp.]OYV07962.1 MAG: acylphosphatase [Methanosaeta sp. ASP1-1]OYV09704.1 MAG: acylphosphatase [Methanosaeta sp. NSP1]OYV12169.1 MAG: acylphosphatase [Methanosaeta sp. NSM2]OYV12264.1 MAG: acylphosphatase [Methanosaeta sp. ASO1]OYV12969.1 MAG: acylphosphatase [Methanosaeta sp. ASM2]
MIAVHVRVSGRVEGVYYRAFTRDKAIALGVKGWVRNVPGGGVEAVLEGDRKTVGELLKAMKTGPTGAIVLGMELSELEARGYEDFEIEY